MLINEEEYKNRLNQLVNKVNHVTDVKQKSLIPIKFNILYIYIGVPILFFIILLITKPGIIMTEVKDEKTFFIDKKINYIKVLLFTGIAGVISCVIYFVNNFKNKKS
jgi:hypothetical protein